MKTQLRQILIALVMISCGGNRNSSAEVESSVQAEEIDFFVLDLENNITERPKAMTLNELIDSISYIPLETHKDALFPGDRHVFANIEGNLFINGGSVSRPSPIYRFNSLGLFTGQMTHIGRGPNEVLLPIWWYANANLRQINVIDMASKMVIVQADSGKRSTVGIDLSQGSHIVPLNDSTFVSAQALHVPDTPRTYLYFIDHSGNVIHSIERNDELSSYNSSSSEYAQAPPYENYWLAPNYKGDAIFHDIFNDTLYRIKSRSEITPHLVFKRGALSPRPEDTHKLERKKKQVYFTRVMESGDYVFLNYYYDGTVWRDVWCKRDGSLQLHTVLKRPNYPFDIFIPFTLPDGSVIELQIAYADKDNIYCVMEALDACKFLPGVKEDDNPIVVAKLKK